MRGTACKKWEEGQRERRAEGRESSRRLGAEKKRAVSLCKQGEREERLLVLASEWVRVRERKLVHI